MSNSSRQWSIALTTSYSKRRAHLEQSLTGHSTISTGLAVGSIRHMANHRPNCEHRPQSHEPCSFAQSGTASLHGRCRQPR